VRRLAQALKGYCAIAGVIVVAGCSSPEGGGGSESGAPSAAVTVVGYGRPEGVSVTENGLRSAVLSWSVPETRIYRYRIERSEALGGPYAWVADVAPNKQTYTDGMSPVSRLKDSTTYYYRMCTVFDKMGQVSEPTQPVKTTTAPPPVPPASLKAEATSSRAVTLTWPGSASEGVTSYRIERTASEQPDAFEKVGEVRDAQFVDGGTPASTLKDSTKYLYRVIAINRVAAESVPSAASEALTFPPPAPPVKPVAVSEEVRCVPLTWEASPESDVIRYDVYQARAAEGPFEKIGAAKGRENARYLDGGANPGTLEDEGTYFYRVRAVNNVTAESADSESTRAVTRAVPPEVQQVAVVSARPREVPVSWALSPDKAVVGYEVWRATADADDWAQIVRLNSRDVTTYLDRGGEKDGTLLGQLKDGTDYQYKVIAFNTANVRSSASGSVKAQTKVVPVPPAGLATTTGLARTVRLTWQPNPEKDVNGYLVEYSKKPADGFKKLTVVRAAGDLALTVDDPDLEPNLTRYYRVRALDKEGLESLCCEAVQGRSKPLPDAPTGLHIQAEGNTIRVLWQAPAQTDVVQYKVWSKKMLFGWDLVATTEQPEYRVGLTDLPKAMTLAVSAVDVDKLESDKGETIKVEPNAQ
jgi:fibronectin type 3 domain-containing protein